ncbi:ferrochelatase-2, chloroplastic [Candidatus Magnetobacterium bavaricum]|uniref:Ferrochelatase n=1 Tax=Candidatus Magnetobacterium bavaricum TaxID=29290 RepID=A0A0F3H008_9BACT|nr:ferrochelatase-2, chloroplastic [Candidatus Magnetobacterium bavaricum]
MTEKRNTTGVLLLNLGGPDSLEAVRPFLYNLFSDRLIIKLGPAFLQRPIAASIALNRAPKTRAMYQQIGGASPITRLTLEQANALQTSIGEGFTVYVGMRYWHPFIEAAVERAYEDGMQRLIALTLYPHYSLATTGSAFAELQDVLKTYTLPCNYIRSWPQNKLYVDALVKSIEEAIGGDDLADCHILMSAHGLPVYFIENGDPYLDELNKTIDLIKERLPGPTYHLSFQSRSGPVKWLTPSTEEMLIQLAGKGVRRLIVVAISFVSDHIETLYEIDILYTNLAKKHGIILKRARALNTEPLFIEALKDLVHDANKW